MGTEGETVYNADYHVMQFCNGSLWVAVGGAGGSLSSLTAGTAVNTIDSTLYTQTWNWSTLATATSGLSLNATNASGGANSTLSVTNTTTGAGFGVASTLSGASNTGYALYGSNASATGYGIYSNGAAKVAGALTVTGATTLSGLSSAGVVLNSAAGLLSTSGGALAVANGGTGIASYTIGDIPFASGVTTLSKLADVATGNALLSGGIGVAPAWGKVGLTTAVTGTLPVANGGTGIVSGTQYGIPYFSTTTLMASTGAGTTTTLLHGNAAGSPTWSAINLSNDVTGSLPVANGGTGATAFTPGSVVFAGASGVYSQDNANFFWDAANHRLGVGTSSPSALLTVAGNESLTGTLSLTNAHSIYSTNSSGGVQEILDLYTDNNLYVSSPGSLYFRPNNSGTVAMDVDASGNVGIGTTTPTIVAGAGLHISNSGGAELRLQRTTAFSILDDGGRWELRPLSQSAQTGLVFRDDGRIAIGMDANGIGTNKFGVTGNSYFNGNVDVYNSASGATPYQPGLTVENSGRAVMNMLGGTDSAIFFGGASPSANTDGQIDFVNSTHSLYLTAGGTSGGISIVAPSYGSVPKVGIGTTGPDSLLSLSNGNLHIGNTSLTSQSNLLFDRGAVASISATQGTLGFIYDGGVGTNNEAFVFNVPSGDDYRFKVNAADLMVIKNNGNVGIGTTNPLSWLQLIGSNGQLTANLTDAGDRRASLALDSASAAAGSGFAITFGNGQSETAGTIGWAAIKALLANGSGNTTGDLAFSTRNSTSDANLTERMRIQGGGNVGIGTTAPNIAGYAAGEQVLTLLGSTQPGSALELASSQAVADGVVASDVAFEDSNLVTSKRLALIRSTMKGAAVNDAGGQLDFLTKTNGGGLADVMTISNAGNVGIGTAVPTTRLVVQNSANGASPQSADANANNIVIIHNDNTGLGNQLVPAGLTIVRDKTSGVAAGDILGGISWDARYDAEDRGGYANILAVTNSIGGSADITFNPARTALTPAEAMRITGAGYVGIGTTNPTTSLDVEAAQDTATGIKVVNTNNTSSASAWVGAIAQNNSIAIQPLADGFSRGYAGFHSGAAVIFGNATNGLNIISDAGGAVGGNTGMIRFITDNSAGGITSHGGGNDSQDRMVITPAGEVDMYGNAYAGCLEVGGWLGTSCSGTWGSGNILAAANIYCGACGNWLTAWLSDNRLKKNIRPLGGDNLALIEKLHAVTWDWRKPSERTIGKKIIFNDPNRRQMGLIAQDVEKVFPLAITTGNNGVKSFVQGGLTAPIVEAIKQLKALNDNEAVEIKQLKAANDNLQSEVAELKKAVAQQPHYRVYYSHKDKQPASQ